MPGLVNAHTHVAMTLMRGYGDDLPLDTWLTGRIFPFEDKLTGEDVYWGSLLGMAEMIATGTTSFTDMYYFCDRIAEAALACGIKANIGRGISCFDPAKSFRDLPAYGEIRELLSSMQGAGEGRIRIDVAPIPNIPPVPISCMTRRRWPRKPGRVCRCICLKRARNSLNAWPAMGKLRRSS